MRNGIEIPKIQKTRFYFTNKEIVMIAAFFALMMFSEIIWVGGLLIGNIFYGIVEGIIVITAALVIGKKYTILTLGIVKTIVEFSLANMYGGTLVALSYLAAAIVLEIIFQVSGSYGNNLKIDVIGATVYGTVLRVTGVSITVFFYGMTLPLWLIIILVILPIIPFTIGGFLGYKLGERVKNVVESV
jgi:hypothetical protein